MRKRISKTDPTSHPLVTQPPLIRQESLDFRIPIELLDSCRERSGVVSLCVVVYNETDCTC